MSKSEDQGTLEKSRTFMSTRSASRKFAGKETRPQGGSDDSSNGSHVVDQAASLTSISRISSRMAGVARDQIQGVRDSLSNAAVEPRGDNPPSETKVGDDELLTFNLNSVKSISALVDDGDSQTPRHLLAVREMIGNGDRMIFVPSEPGRSTTNEVVPTVVSISVGMDKKKGVIDCFFSRATFSLPRGSNIAAVRIFRAEAPRSALGSSSGRLSVRGMEMLRADRNQSRQKNNDVMSALENRLRESGVDNAIGTLIPIDPFLNIRVGASSKKTSLNIVRTVSVGSVDTASRAADLAPFLVPAALVHLDRSVVNDLKTLRNIQVQNPSLSVGVLNASVKVGAKAGQMHRLNPEHAEQLASERFSSDLVVGSNNGQKFREIAFTSPDKLASITMGDAVEYTYDDPTVTYGKVYRYYLVSVDNEMNESVRSRIVEVVVDGVRVPERPKNVSARVFNQTIALTIQVDDQLVEKFEVYRKSDDPSAFLGNTSKFKSVLAETGFVVEDVSREKLQNSMVQVGEAMNSILNGGTIFIDRRVIPGRTYTYRVYSVDLFGNKSESPYEIDVYVPDLEHRIVGLNKPSIMAEVDSKTNKCRVTFGVDDDRVHTLILKRRDMTLGQRAFTNPDGVNILKLGTATPSQGGKRFEDVRMNDKSRDVAWSGFFTDAGEQHVFIDNTVMFDHTYQYMVVGMDRFGNQTSMVLSRPVFVMRRPFINAPLDLDLQIVTESARVSGVRLTWTDGNIDITAEDRVGNREELANSSVRTLYQIERRKKGEDRWLEFPLTEERELIDSLETTSGSTPNFRPPYLKLNDRYIYRVQTFQTGNFISNFSAPVEIFVGAIVLPPENFQLRAPDTKVRPFYVMLNWDTADGSGVVDKWEIERAAVNNIAAGRLNVRNPDEMSKLTFLPFREVFRESSRFRSIAQDKFLVGRTNKTVTGEHHFMDTSVRFGNSYFYRIRAIDPGSVSSPWSYKGVKVTDGSHEEYQNFALSREDRSKLASTLAPADFGESGVDRRSSFGLVSSFASPTTMAKGVGSTLDANSVGTRGVMFNRTRKFR